MRIFWHAKLQNTLIETEKHEKRIKKKRTFDAHQNQYINGVHKIRSKNSRGQFPQHYRNSAYPVPARCRQEGSLRRPEKRIPYTKLDFSCRPQGDPTTD